MPDLSKEDIENVDAEPQGPINKKAVYLVSLIVAMLLIFGIASVFKPKEAGKQEVAQEEVVRPQSTTLPAVIREAPDSVLVERDNEPVPSANDDQENRNGIVLGPKLPGDAGGLLVEPQQQNKTPDIPLSPYSSQNKVVDKELEAARKSGLTVKRGGSAGSPLDSQQQAIDRLLSAQRENISDFFPNGAPSAGPGSGFPGGGDQNNQAGKNAFLANNRNAVPDTASLEAVEEPSSPYELKAGTIIPIVLKQAINSDLPGDVFAQVRQNIYDSVSGRYLLIPAGSTLQALYDSNVTFGQSRILVCWNRLIFPDGSSINLECQPGTDPDGSAGYSGRVDNHYDKLAAGTLISSILSATASQSQGDISGFNASFDQQFAQGIGDQLSNVGEQITQKILNIQPTITKSQGETANVLLNRDLILRPYY